MTVITAESLSLWPDSKRALIRVLAAEKHTQTPQGLMDLAECVRDLKAALRSDGVELDCE